MAKKSSSKKIWYILGGVLVALVLGLLLAKKQGWIGKVDPTEVVFQMPKMLILLKK